MFQNKFFEIVNSIFFLMKHVTQIPSVEMSNYVRWRGRGVTATAFLYRPSAASLISCKFTFAEPHKIHPSAVS